MAQKRQRRTLLAVVLLAVAGTAWLHGAAGFLTAPQVATSRPEVHADAAVTRATEASTSPAAVAASFASGMFTLVMAAHPVLASYDGEAYRYDDRAGLATGWLFGLIFAGVAITGGFVYIFTRPGMFNDNKE
eukprot:TRINITY_DN120764_c0_g1_i1.p1 TRINITY_DN120764_c0_g1~~TRINITY_DN120764_c0_g1_i1.p1  ORF type:complete len:154 (-),score=20.42 TRINITY_DN120764_c0_g1_i1:198-593(-)